MTYRVLVIALTFAVLPVGNFVVAGEPSESNVEVKPLAGTAVRTIDPPPGLSSESQAILQKEVDLPKPIATPYPPAERRILEALQKPVTLSFDGTPWPAAIGSLARAAEIPFRIDESIFKKPSGRFGGDPIGRDEPVRLEVEQVPAGIALNRLLDENFPGPMGWTIEHGVLLIARDVESTPFLKTRVYDVSDLVLRRDKQGLLRRDYAQLINVIRSTTRGPWMTIDGWGGTIRIIDTVNVCALCVRQSLRVHRENDSVLARLRALQHAGPFRAGEPLKPRPTAETDAERSIQEGVKQNVSVEFQQTPLEDALREIAKSIGVEVHLDELSLAEDGIAADEPITLKAVNRPADSVLKEMFEPLGLTWIVKRDALYVTMEYVAERTFRRRIYDVADLTPHRDAGGLLQHNFAQLIDLIEWHTAGPWEMRDGEGGRISEFETIRINALVVEQADPVHREIDDLLKSLRGMGHERLPAALPGRRLRRRWPVPMSGGGFGAVRPDAARAGMRVAAQFSTADEKLDRPRSNSGCRDARASKSPLSQVVQIPVPKPATIPDIDRKIQQALETTISVDFEGTPLREAIAFLDDRLPIAIAMDENSVSKAARRTPVTLKLERFSARCVLGNLLAPLKFAWINEEEALVVASGEVTKQFLHTRIYDIADLVLARDQLGRVTRDSESLIELILDQTAGLWDEVDATDESGTITRIETSHVNVFAIRQTVQVHEEIADILVQLRRVRHDDLPVAITVEPIDDALNAGDTFLPWGVPTFGGFPPSFQETKEP